MVDHWIDGHLGPETLVRPTFVPELETRLADAWGDDEIVPSTDAVVEPRRRRVIVWLAIAAAAAVATTVYVVQRSTEPATPAATTIVPVTTISPATTQPTTTAATTTTTSADAPPFAVTPFGARADFVGLRIYQNDVRSPQGPFAPGEVVLSYVLQVGFDAGGRPGRLVMPATTDDGELALASACKGIGCDRFQGESVEIQVTVPLVITRTAATLTAGVHDATSQLRYDDGSVQTFAIVVRVDPLPSDSISAEVQSSSGAPVAVQYVYDVGNFAYHQVSAFGSIWVLGKNSRTVTRVDAVTGAVVARISLPPNATFTTSPSRLAASSDAVLVSAQPMLRIDPSNNSVSAVKGNVFAQAVIADGRTAWTTGRSGEIQRVDADDTITTLRLPRHPWMDLAVSHGLVWALSQERPQSHLIAFDEATGRLVHDVVIPSTHDGFPVRLVADEDSVVVGYDTSGGGGRTGSLTVIDPVTAAITGTVDLASRPEGIGLTPHHIWTSAALLDRATLHVRSTDRFGFTIAIGPDGSIWASSGIPGSSTAQGSLVRYAPGDQRG